MPVYVVIARHVPFTWLTSPFTRRPNSLGNMFIHVLAYLDQLIKFQYTKYYPFFSSMTDFANNVVSYDFYGICVSCFNSLVGYWCDVFLVISFIVNFFFFICDFYPVCLIILLTLCCCKWHLIHSWLFWLVNVMGHPRNYCWGRPQIWLLHWHPQTFCL